MAGNKQFGKNLKRLRENKGISQEELAEIIGVEYQTISRIETGMYFTSYDNLQKIAKGLSVTTKDLFDFTEKDYSIEELKQFIHEELLKLNKTNLELIYKIIQIIGNKNYK